MTPEEAVDALEKAVVGAAMRVMNALGPGLNEKCYENALVVELRACGHRVDQQRRFDVFYRGTKVGVLIPDLIVDDLLVVDPKTVEKLGNNEVAQMITYLAVTGLSRALLINFNRRRLEWRKVHPKA